MAAQQLQVVVMVVVGGQQMADPAVAVSTVYTPVSAAQMVEWLTEVGFDEEQHRAEMVTALRDNER